jgi:hypothetical protein
VDAPGTWAVPAETAWGAPNAAAMHGDRGLFDLIAAQAGRTADRADEERLYAAPGLFEEPALAWTTLQERWSDLAARLRADACIASRKRHEGATSRFLERSDAGP